MAAVSDGFLTTVITVVSRCQNIVMRRRMGACRSPQPGNGAMDVNRTHTLRIYSVRSTVDTTIVPLNKEQPMFALIRQFSRYILISN